MSAVKKWAEECTYLAHLIETDGNADVPRDAMESYFRCQIASAERDRFYALAATLRHVDSTLRFPLVASTDGWFRTRIDCCVALRAHAAALAPSGK